jgi:polyribonucleotide nucleotidyltransferase
MQETIQFELDGKTVAIETGRMAKQADGATLVTVNGCAVLTTACAVKGASLDMDFFPLTVEYKEKYYASGRFPGGFFKREGRGGSREILTSRLIDRSIRPMFADGFRNEVQVISTVLSHDRENPTDMAAMVGTSAALSISSIPFDGPIGAVRVGMVDGRFVLNPTYDEQLESTIDMVVAGTKDAIAMVEGELKCIPEATLIKALERAHEGIQTIIGAIEELTAKVGKDKMEVNLFQVDAELKENVYRDFYENFKKASDNPDKLARGEAIESVAAEIKERYETDENARQLSALIHDMESEVVRENILVNKRREDGRQLNEIRPIDIEVGTLQRAHGSALFTRGQTQSLGVLTLGAESSKQMVDDVTGISHKRFLLHYNFPPYSVGEVKRLGPIGRREIGHGMLAERALTHVLPAETDFPYAIRIVSEILESNGSSSMATVCSGSLALMDGGVPIKEHVAGIAMGLIMSKDGSDYVVLTDIQGLEDHCGDMDFKVAGTKSGITAIQMDIKVKGVSFEIITQALDQALEARQSILEKMTNTISGYRQKLSQFAPVMETIRVKAEKIKDVIGSGGKTVKMIISETGTDVNISDSGDVSITSIEGREPLEKAKAMIEDAIADIEIGDFYTGKVTRIENYGCFVTIPNGKQVLIHISQLADNRVAKTEDVVSMGDVVRFKVSEVDKQGRISGSLRGVSQDE